MVDELSEAVLGDVELVRIPGHRDLERIHRLRSLRRHRPTALRRRRLPRGLLDRPAGGQGIV
jgi:hypothetical protein